ncbi:uncharacterized protein LOC119310794 [Triticum dicoccoides]|uniref:uncharacterized protein LOC119310794 n=1 Tax=Triticum dicoccoides TaxID=85692 RepID=UPI001891CBB4|nr:uncharacterized protein LOC119310794 [Triticum dicoccoides]
MLQRRLRWRLGCDGVLRPPVGGALMLLALTSSCVRAPGAATGGSPATKHRRLLLWSLGICDLSWCDAARREHPVLRGRLPAGALVLVGSIGAARPLGGGSAGARLKHTMLRGHLLAGASVLPGCSPEASGVARAAGDARRRCHEGVSELLCC